MANTFFDNVGHFYAKHVMPVLLDMNCIVDKANGNGLGQRSLKGPGIAQVFMSTSGTPAVFNGVTNNVPDGFAQVFLSQNYNRYFGGFSGFVSPVSGSAVLVASAGVVKGTVYTIVAVGTTTLAGWQSLGLPLGIVPAVGACFVASATATTPGTGAVEVAAAAGSGIASVEVFGNPSLTLSPNINGIVTATAPALANPYLILRFMAPGSNGTNPVPMAVKQPADGATFGAAFYLSNSSVQVRGE